MENERTLVLEKKVANLEKELEKRFGGTEDKDKDNREGRPFVSCL